MNEKTFDETVLGADTGTLTIRSGYGCNKMWLGIHQGNNPNSAPDIGMFLTPHQQNALIEAIDDLTFIVAQNMQER